MPSSRAKAALHLGHATLTSACKIIRLSIVRPPLLFRLSARQKSVGSQLLAELQHGLREIAVAISSNCEALLTGHPVAVLSSVVHSNVDNLSASEFIEAYPNLLTGVLFEFGDHVARFFDHCYRSQNRLSHFVDQLPEI